MGEKFTPDLSRRWWLWIIILPLALGVAGNLLTGPIRTIWRIGTDAASHGWYAGWSAIRDTPYIVAATNSPNSADGLVLTMLAAGLLVFVGGEFAARLKSSRPDTRWLRAAKQEFPDLFADLNSHEGVSREPESSEARRARVVKVLKLYRVYRHFAYVAAFAILLVVLTTEGLALAVTQAATIAGTFEANMTICAPYLSIERAAQLRAAFAGMNSRADYVRIRAALDSISRATGAKLRPETP